MQTIAPQETRAQRVGPQEPRSTRNGRTNSVKTMMAAARRRLTRFNKR